jgi:hypothetical protein
VGKLVWVAAFILVLVLGFLVLVLVLWLLPWL